MKSINALSRRLDSKRQKISSLMQNRKYLFKKISKQNERIAALEKSNRSLRLAVYGNEKQEAA